MLCDRRPSQTEGFVHMAEFLLVIIVIITLLRPDSCRGSEPTPERTGRDAGSARE
jgi:hypothetical protein